MIQYYKRNSIPHRQEEGAWQTVRQSKMPAETNRQMGTFCNSIYSMLSFLLCQEKRQPKWGIADNAIFFIFD